VKKNSQRELHVELIDDQRSFRSRRDTKHLDLVGLVEWNGPTKALTGFLSALGIAKASQLARCLVAEFGTLSDLLTASSWQL